MAIPDSINIGGINITIEYIPLSENENCYGCYHPLEAKISITNELSLSQKSATFIHETLEAMNHIYHIALNHEQIEKLEVALNSSGLINL